MYMLTSPLGLCQQWADFGNLGGFVRVGPRSFARLLIVSRHVGIGRFTYQDHGVIGLTPLQVWLLFVGSKSSTNRGVRLTTPDVLITQPTNHNLPKHALRNPLRCHKVRRSTQQIT